VLVHYSESCHSNAPGISRSAKGYCLISVLETMKTYSAEEGLTEEAVVTKLRICRCHHLYLHSSLRSNSSGLSSHFHVNFLSDISVLFLCLCFIYSVPYSAGTSRWGEFGEGGLLWGECNGKSYEWFDGSPIDELFCKVCCGSYYIHFVGPA
jgi:hypothetical protein